eukprot:g3730.t1
MLSAASESVLKDVKAQSSMLGMLSRMGIQDSSSQVALRKRAMASGSLFGDLEKLNEVLKGGSKFIKGDVYSNEDGELCEKLRDAYLLLLKPEQREGLAELKTWFDVCAGKANNQGKSSVVWSLGASRIGKQIDMRPRPECVARCADRSSKLNEGVKKKETQRQKEKRLKEKEKKKATATEKSGTSNGTGTSTVPSAKPFSFTGLSVGCEKGAEARIDAVNRALKSLSISGTKIVEHPVATTVEEMLAHLKGEIGGKCKNLFLKFSKKKSRTIENDTGLWLVSALHDTKIDTKKLSKHLGYPKELRMGRPDVLKSTLGLVKGECSPFAFINDEKLNVQVILDAAMMKEKVLWFHPLSNTASASITPSDLLKFIAASGREPRIVDFSAL